MKPVDFGYVRPGTIAEAVAILASEPNAKVIAGGQTLGPMLNLRLARPSLLVDISRIPELTRVEESRDTVTLGAGITHAAIEDGRVPDFTNGFLAHVAHGIAYRAVRNRGTIGGSLAHADPAADWLSALTALSAYVEIDGTSGKRSVAVGQFATGAMATVLAHDELITGVRIAKLKSENRWGYHKVCRKTGEFADAIGVIVTRPPGPLDYTAIAGATGGAPIRILQNAHDRTVMPAWTNELVSLGYKGDAYEMQIHAVALQRAYEQATSR